MTKYDHKAIEKKWQNAWEKEKTYQASDAGKKPKKYVLIEFPYPSGEGLHMGHLRPYTAGDTYSRYFRMKGCEVLYPIGWDAFGLPAENFAIKNKVHPRVSTAKNIANAKKQLQNWGISFDWSREINTTDPDYFKWTQWIFLQFYKAGLAYEATGLINWCPKDKTGLANEEVIDGRCERCGTVVEKKELRQWYLKITAYAEKLLEGLKELKEWPEPVKLQQENWIGKSEGAEIEFPIAQKGIRKFIILHGRGSRPKDHFYTWLKKKLESKGFEVQSPQMPGGEEPKDDECADFIQQHCNLDEHTVVIGHSFGGIVALRLLERGARLAGAILVATPFTGKFMDGKNRPTVTAAAKKGFDFAAVIKNCGFFKVISDTTDYVVAMSDGESYAAKLGVNLIKAAAAKPHFLDEQEPELLTIILSRIAVFTTRVDTLPGATFLVLAPEHPLISNLKSQIKNWAEVKKYIENAKKKTDMQRAAVEKEKTGIFLGSYAVNPATKEEIPIWVADYVLMGYGTGAIMAVPAHDERDFEFAKQYKLPIRTVINNPSQPPLNLRGGETAEEPPLNIRGGEGELFTGEGLLINSDGYDGMSTEEARKKIAKDFGQPKVQYKLRDWVFSRQRYWGEPIPLIHCQNCGTVPVPEEDLPVTLPEVKDYEPTGTGESPLAAIDEWVNVKCPNCGGPAKRETNTMPQWAGSSWYWLRYADPDNKKEMAGKKLLKRWTPVDVYFGGMEHTTLHLLYSRFWNLFLYDQGHVTAKEPFTKRVPHGIVLGPDGEKMSKSRGNVVNPDEIIEKFGADALRMYEMFLGPHGDTVSWNDKGIMGIKRFLDRVLRYQEISKDLPRVEKKNLLHKTIKKVTQDIEGFRFNTAISQMMIYLNEVWKVSEDENRIEVDFVTKEEWQEFLKLLAPFAPHLTEELWHQLGHKDSIHLKEWPKFDPKLAQDTKVTFVVQVLGKVRATLEMPAGTSQQEVKEKALAGENVNRHLEGKKIVKEIFVPDKLINFVIK
ncbi:MAG: leucine--tRNA ligase [Candidatus Doudnabacteria bacterium]|nr:leucine--tRNA ligase [Candidatus Doudnabacteria bacterium]